VSGASWALVVEAWEAAGAELERRVASAVMGLEIAETIDCCPPWP
jgi:hypothetical protein